MASQSVTSNERDSGLEHTGRATTRPHMRLEDRAKIFSPFDPLQGFRAALREKELEVEAEAHQSWETEPHA